MKKNIKHICFDLDGTLIDSHKTIYKATVKALNEIGIKNKIDEKKFYNTIGLHFLDIFNVFGVLVEDFNKFISIYKSHYFDYIDYSKPFDNIEDIFGYLKSQNIFISLLTTKGQEQADKIVNHFNLTKYFDYIMGRRDGIAHKPSAEPLLKICDELNVSPDNTLIVGDTEMDILCGKNASAFTCAVTYGYRTKEVLAKFEPDFIIDKIIELKGILNNKTIADN